MQEEYSALTGSVAEVAFESLSLLCHMMLDILPFTAAQALGEDEIPGHSHCLTQVPRHRAASGCWSLYRQGSLFLKLWGFPGKMTKPGGLSQRPDHCDGLGSPCSGSFPTLFPLPLLWRRLDFSLVFLLVQAVWVRRSEAFLPVLNIRLIFNQKSWTSCGWILRWSQGGLTRKGP